MDLTDLLSQPQADCRRSQPHADPGVTRDTNDNANQQHHTLTRTSNAYWSTSPGLRPRSSAACTTRKSGERRMSANTSGQASGAGDVSGSRLTTTFACIALLLLDPIGCVQYIQRPCHPLFFQCHDCIAYRTRTVQYHLVIHSLFCHFLVVMRSCIGLIERAATLVRA